MTAPPAPTVPGSPSPPSPVPTLARAYAAGCLALTAAAAAAALLPAAGWLAHAAVGLPLHARLRPAPPPRLAGAVALLGANLRATGWPLIPAALRAGRSAGLRRLVDITLAAGLTVNLVPVAAALGVYRLRLLPYLPQLPLELYALTSGAAAWWLSSRRHTTRRQLALIAASLLAALAGAAALETWAVPHR